MLDFGNEIRDVYRKPISAEANGSVVVSMVAETARALVESAHEQGLSVSAVGLALPGPVLDPALGRVRTGLQSGRAEMEFVPDVRRESGVETYAAANDICFALGHHRMHPTRDGKADLIVLNRFGVSAALIRGAELYSGHLGLLPYGTQQPMVRYRDVCTGGAILRLARSRGDSRQFQELISSPNDPLMIEWLASAIPAFAQAIYSAAMMYCPDRLIIDGIFNILPKEVREEMTGMVRGEMSRMGIAAPEIGFFQGDDLMGARGGAFVARDQVADEVITSIVRTGKIPQD